MAMKTIIVATDFSPAAENALKYAVALSVAAKTEMVVHHSLPLSHSTAKSITPLPNYRKELENSKQRLLNLTSEIEATYHIKVRAACGTALLLDDLEELTKEYNEALVVVGMREDSWERMMFGSMTISILEAAKYPVLVVPTGTHFTGIAEIVLAVDNQQVPGQRCLRPLVDFASINKAKIQVLHIEKGAKKSNADALSDENSALENYTILKDYDLSYKELNSQTVVDGIAKGIEIYNADIIAMIPHKKHFWNLIFNKSNTQKMAAKSTIPLLTLPDYSW